MDVAGKFATILVDHLGVEREKCVPEADLIDDLGADSIDFVDVTIAIEEVFGIDVSDDEAAACSTVSQFVAMIEGKLA